MRSAKLFNELWKSSSEQDAFNTVMSNLKLKHNKSGVSLIIFPHPRHARRSAKNFCLLNGLRDRKRGGKSRRRKVFVDDFHFCSYFRPSGCKNFFSFCSSLTIEELWQIYEKNRTRNGVELCSLFGCFPPLRLHSNIARV